MDALERLERFASEDRRAEQALLELRRTGEVMQVARRYGIVHAGSPEESGLARVCFPEPPGSEPGGMLRDVLIEALAYCLHHSSERLPLRTRLHCSGRAGARVLAAAGLAPDGGSVLLMISVPSELGWAEQS